MPDLDWNALTASEFQLPPGTDLPALMALVDAAFTRLQSPDPTERDEQAYPALATWLETGLLDTELTALGERCVALFAAPEVHSRSFGALVLAEVISREAQVGSLGSQTTSPQTRRAWTHAWAQWYVHETDLRSHTPEQGWLHALAHGADVAAVLGQHPAMTRPELREVLATLLRRISTVDTVPIQYEDDRLALAAFVLLTRSELSHTDRLRWLVGLRAHLTPAPGSPRSPAAAFAAQVARSLLVFTHHGAQLPGGAVISAARATAWQPALLGALHVAFAFAYPALSELAESPESAG